MRSKKTSKDALLKLVHDLSLTIYHLTNNKSMSIKRSIINMINKLFINTPMYMEIREILLNEIRNHSLGKSTTFQDYRNNREKIFEIAQTSLYNDVKNSITYEYSGHYVSFLMKSKESKIVIKCGENRMKYAIKINKNRYNYGGIKIGNHIIPLFPINIKMFEQTNQCLRQWTRAIYSNQYRLNPAADIILYYYLTDALNVYLSDVDLDIKRAYINLSWVMLDRVRFGTSLKEIIYLKEGNPPAPVVGSISKMDYILKKCVGYANLKNTSPYTLWYGIVLMLGCKKLELAQYNFCKNDILKDIKCKEHIIQLSPQTTIKYLKRQFNKIKTCKVDTNDNYDYTCYITLNDTSKPHQIQKK